MGADASLSALRRLFPIGIFAGAHMFHIIASERSSGLVQTTEQGMAAQRGAWCPCRQRLAAHDPALRLRGVRRHSHQVALVLQVRHLSLDAGLIKLSVHWVASVELQLALPSNKSHRCGSLTC